MSGGADFVVNQATADQVAEHLRICDDSFVPALSSRVSIDQYAATIVGKAVRIEAWQDGRLIGLVAVYCNDPSRRVAFLTNMSVLPAWRGRGIASGLLARGARHASENGFAGIELEVDRHNIAAVQLYASVGYVAEKGDGQSVKMHLDIGGSNAMDGARNLNVEIKDVAEHQYSYAFDFDVMHPYMIESFEPFFKKGTLLELGSYKGDMTRRLIPFFEDVTCVEGSSEALAEAKEKLGERVRFVHACFEDVQLPARYDHIVLTHVLEHLDDPVRVLKRINDEWLADGGRFFLVCPNANAPSRQIAVKMGLISHNAAVTPAEAKHGHRITYSLDTLERDVVAAGLKVVHRSGIFFKALANFQWDRLLQTDIISKEYLEGCYALGQQYPDLCSSIFLLCEKGP